MTIGRVLYLATICVAGIVATRGHQVEPTHEHADEAELLTEAATHNFIAHILLPFWMLPGFGDYLCHRDSDIEHTSGTHESLTHLLMISSTGAGVLIGMFFEINESALLVMTGSALFHEAVVLWDVAYAQKVRPPSDVEQHMHSFLEVLPFTALASMCCLHPKVAQRFFRTPLAGRTFKLELKRNPEPAGYITAVMIMGTLALALPFAEEFIRCFKVDGTILPHS